MVHNIMVSQCVMLVFYNLLPDDGPSWCERCRRIFVKLNYNKSAFSWF